MSEIEKLMQNAGIKKLLYCDICKAQENALGLCAETKCEPFYPPFTAEKQFYIIKFVAKIEWIDNISSIVYRPLEDEWGIFADSLTELSSETPKIYGFTRKTFEEALAKLVNDLWQDLTEEEKAEIKRILE